MCFLIEGNQFFFIAILSLRKVVSLLSKSKSSKIPAHSRTAVNYTHEHARQLKNKNVIKTKRNKGNIETNAIEKVNVLNKQSRALKP